MLFVNTFEYDGIKSAKYGLFFGHVDTERLKRRNASSKLSLSRTATFGIDFPPPEAN